jgi:hypothetical protein
MKQLILSFLLIGCCLSSCLFRPQPLDQLPPATQEGANTLTGRFISGTFEFMGRDPARGSTLQIFDGRFDVPY